jgi:surfactin synthase thioesterase subunit
MLTPGNDHRETVVVVLPYAGAAVMPTAALAQALAPEIGVVASTYPGHGSRVSEDPIRDADDLIDAVAAAVSGLGARRVVLLGYSMGGRIGYEVAWRLTDAGRPPAGFVPCMSRPPHTGIGHAPVASLPEDEFVREAVRLGLLSGAIAYRADAAPYVRALRADLHIVETVPPCRTTPLRVPTAVVGATGDHVVPEGALRRWADLVVGSPLQLRVTGPHLAWLEHPTTTAEVAARAIRHVLASSAAATGERR